MAKRRKTKKGPKFRHPETQKSWLKILAQKRRRRRGYTQRGTRRAYESFPFTNGPFGLPWWAWLGLGAGALYLFSKRVAAQPALPAGVTPALSKLQDDIAKAAEAALGFPDGRLIVNIKSVNGPVSIVDRKNNATVAKSSKGPADVLLKIKQGALDKYWTDSFSALDLTNVGWQSGSIPLGYGRF